MRRWTMRRRLGDLAHRLLGPHAAGELGDLGASTGEAHPPLGIRLREATCVVLDLETTGLRPGVDRVVSLGAVRVAGGAILADEGFSCLVQPGCRIPPASTAIHGIGDADVAGAPPLRAVLAAFRAFVGPAVPVVHHAEFDVAFLARPLARAGLPPLRRVLDTALLGQVFLGPRFDGTLDSLAQPLGVSLMGRHTAVGDALIAAEVLLRLLPWMEVRGAETLAAALTLQGGDGAAYPRRGRPMG